MVRKKIGGAKGGGRPPGPPMPVSATASTTPIRDLYRTYNTLLSVQCYAWTEYKFTRVCVCLCACVCVCVSVTLSVNSPTGQTPQRHFTVDSTKDAHLRKDVPFAGLDNE